MEPKQVSVITPTYNRARRVLECIESVRRQSYEHVEHIVVDDGSTDGTVEKMAVVYPELIASGRLKIFTQPNAGPGAARNRGIAQSRGEFIAYLDSDDLYLDSHIETLVAPLLADNRYGVTYGRHLEIWHGPDGTRTRQVTGPDSDVDPLKLRFKNQIPLMFMHRRALLDQIGTFDTDRRGLEDWDLLMRLSEAAYFLGLPAVTGVWRHFESEPSVTAELQGDEREKKYLRVLKRGMRRELEGQISMPELRADLDALNRHMFKSVVAAAKTRMRAPAGFNRTIVDIPLELTGVGTVDSLFMTLQRAVSEFHDGVQLRITFGDDRSPAVEWIQKINKLLGEEGLPGFEWRVEPPGEKQAA